MGTNKKSHEDISKTVNFFVLYVINLFHDSLFTDISKYIRRKKEKPTENHRKSLFGTTLATKEISTNQLQ